MAKVDSSLLFAARNYQSRGASTAEFLEDFKRISNISRTINRYNNGTSTINVRMVMNQIVVLSNTFGVSAATELLLDKVDESCYGILIPMLVFLGYATEEHLSRKSIDFDADVVRSLREMN